MKTKLFVIWVATLLFVSTFSISLNNVTALTASELEYKHYKWTLKNVDFSAKVDISDDAKEADINKMLSIISGIVNGFDGSELHILTGESSFDSIYISAYFMITSTVTVPKDFFLALNSIAKWSAGEDLYIDEETASKLEFYIPAESVLPLTPNVFTSIYSTAGIGIADYTRLVISTIMDETQSRMSMFDSSGLSNTIKMEFSTFVPGMPIALPDIIKNYKDNWENAPSGINANYEESDNKAIFTASGSYSDSEVDMSLDFRAEYDLTTGVLTYLKASYSISAKTSGAPMPDLDIETPVSPSGFESSGSFEIAFDSAQDFAGLTGDNALLEPGEPIAFKMTSVKLSEDLMNLIGNITGSEPTEYVSYNSTLFQDAAESVDGWQTDNWTLTSSIAHSGTYSWFITNMDSYSEYELISPEINVSGSSEVYVQFYVFINASFASSFYLNVYYSEDGVSWNFIKSIEGESTYNWEFVSASEYIGDASTIRLKFVADVSYADPADFIAIDDIAVIGETSKVVELYQLLSNMRFIYTYLGTPNGLDAAYKFTPQYLEGDKIYNLSSGTTYASISVAGAPRINPDFKSIIYGQMLLEVHTIANIFPKLIYYLLHYIHVKEGKKVPTFEISSKAGVYESREGHFAILTNVSYKVDYSDAEENATPFKLEGYGGVWYVYKKEGYLVETGFQFKLKLIYDTDGDGSLDDESYKEYSLEVITNKVVSKKVTKYKATVWVIEWDKLDSDPPSFNSDEWNLVMEPTPPGTSWWIWALIIVGVVGIAGAAFFFYKKRQQAL